MGSSSVRTGPAGWYHILYHDRATLQRHRQYLNHIVCNLTDEIQNLAKLLVYAVHVYNRVYKRLNRHQYRSRPMMAPSHISRDGWRGQSYRKPQKLAPPFIWLSNGIESQSESSSRVLGDIRVQIQTPGMLRFLFII